MKTTKHPFGFPYVKDDRKNELSVSRCYYAMCEPQYICLGEPYVPYLYYAIYEDSKLAVFGCWNDDDTLAEQADMLNPEDFFQTYEDYLDYLLECTEPDFEECFPPDWVVEMRQVVHDLASVSCKCRATASKR